MSKKTILAAVCLSCTSVCEAQGSVSLGFGVEREGVDVVLDYSLPKTAFESYKVSMRYQGSTLNSFNQSLVIGGSAGLYGSWGPYTAFLMPGFTLNLIENEGLGVGPSSEMGTLLALDAVMSIGFSKFDNWVWLGKNRGLVNSSFILNFDYKL